MDKLLEKLGAILGIDQVALSEDGSAPAEILTGLTNLNTEIVALRSERQTTAQVLDGIRDALGLSAEDGLAVAQGKILALAETAKADAAALSTITDRVQALETAKADGEKQELIQRGLREGKLTSAMAEGWAPKQDTAVLKSYLESAPPVCKPGQTVLTRDLPAGDNVALSDTDKRVAALLGVKPEDMQATKKQLRTG